MCAHEPVWEASMSHVIPSVLLSHFAFKTSAGQFGEHESYIFGTMARDGTRGGGGVLQLHVSEG